MFEVDPNLWLQSFAAPWLTWLMQAVSLLGQEWFYAAVVLVVGFGLRLRPMLGVMLALLLTGLGTHAVKDGFGLPRPVQVDARVLDKGGPNTRWLAERGGATEALGLPTTEAIDAARALPDPDFGFSSGHVAAATAFCASLLLAFAGLRRHRALAVAIALWPVLMALSRLYLGRHFLGDVLGGACLGLLASISGWWLWRRQRHALPLLAVALCIAAWLLPLVDRATTGQLLGLALLAALLARGGWPEDAPATAGMRLGRVALAFALYAVAKIATHALMQAMGWDDGHFMQVPVVAATTLFVLGGTVWLARCLRLYPASTA